MLRLLSLSSTPGPYRTSTNSPKIQKNANLIVHVTRAWIRAASRNKPSSPPIRQRQCFGGRVLAESNAENLSSSKNCNLEIIAVSNNLPTIPRLHMLALFQRTIHNTRLPNLPIKFQALMQGKCWSQLSAKPFVDVRLLEEVVSLVSSSLEFPSIRGILLNKWCMSWVIL